MTEARSAAEEEGGCKNERHFFPGVTLHSHPHWLVLPEDWWVSGQLQVSGQAPGTRLCSWHYLCDPPSAPASTSLRASPPLSSFLPAFPFFLSPYLTDCGSKMAQIYGSTHQK